MTCSFTLSHEGRTHELLAERVSEGESIETWRVQSRGDRNAFLLFSNDRPTLHAQHRYTDRYKWTVLEGESQYRKMSTQITTYLEYFIKGQWKPPKKGKSGPKLTDPSPQGKLF